MRNGWTATVPRGTEPKSLDSSSNIASAQEARAGPAAANTRKVMRLNRTMLFVSPEPTRDFAATPPEERFESPEGGAAQAPRGHAANGRPLVNSAQPVGSAEY